MKDPISFTLKIRLDNDAFKPFPGNEVARLIREEACIAEAFQSFVCGTSRALRDINGNEVGTVTIC